MNFATWSYPTEIRFGVGRINELSEVCRANNIKRPLFVTDRNLVVLESTQNIIKKVKKDFFCNVFNDVDSNPNEMNLFNGIEVFNSGRHDGVICFGGGSGLDLGKLIALMASQSRAVWDFEDVDDWWKRARTENICPIIAVPTTAGTGSEVGRASVLTNSISKEKKIIFHPKLLPSTVICDPNLTLTMPQLITAGTGLDAFAHCFEAYCSPFFHPMSHGIALEGMRLVKDNLLKVYLDGSNILARSEMMSAAMMGAVAFQKGLGVIHALSHPIGGLYNTHHGMTNAVLMPFVLKFNATEITEKIKKLALYLEITNEFEGFVKFVEELNKELNVPINLTALGVPIDGIDNIIDGAMKDPSRLGNPKELTADNLRVLLNSVF